jgi:rhamnosyl/mannosyltransferase
MKILHLGKFFPPDRGGMETYLAHLARGTRKWGDVEVAVASETRPAGSRFEDGVLVRRLRTFGVVAATPICPEMFWVIDRAKPDLVHLHHPNPLAMAAYLASGTSAPCIVTYHSDIVRQRMLRRMVAPIVRETLRRSAAIIVASPQVLDYSPVLEPFRAKCHVVPFGIDLAGADRVSTTLIAHLKRRYGQRLVLAVGRLTEYKGFEHLIRAMARIDASLVLIGDGRLRPHLERLVRTEGLSDRVHLLGNVPDVAPYYAACDVFVLPSVTRNEAFGIVQLEAMAAGKPIVNTALESGVTYVSPADVTGLTVPPADSVALAGAIERLLGDEALRRRLGNAGRARVQTEFSVDTMVLRTVRIYGEATRSAAELRLALDEHVA